MSLTLLYSTGFFVDINLFKANKERAAEIASGSQNMVENINENGSTNSKDDLADDDANLMIKLKFLTYKVHVLLLTFCVLLLPPHLNIKCNEYILTSTFLQLRTFLIRNGLSILFKEGPPAYKAYYLR